MRLINAATLQLEDFVNESQLQYVILSHRWEDEEVLFQDLQHIEKAKKKRGFAKLKKCCKETLAQGYKYAWVDTCCIDKSSSAELSEAINFMYRWYGNATI